MARSAARKPKSFWVCVVVAGLSGTASVITCLGAATLIESPIAMAYGNGYVALNLSSSAKKDAQSWFDRPNGTEVSPGGLPEVIPTPTGSIIVFPFSIPFLLASTAAVFIYRRNAKAKPGTCQTCRYDLTGNTSGVCPECGTTR